MGAAFATLISEIVLLTISWNVAKRATTLTIDIVKMLKLTFIGSFSVLLGYSLKKFEIYFLWNLIFVVAIYVTFSYYLNAIPKSAVKNYLNSLKGKWTKQTSQSL